MLDTEGYIKLVSDSQLGRANVPSAPMFPHEHFVHHQLGPMFPQHHPWLMLKSV